MLINPEDTDIYDNVHDIGSNQANLTVALESIAIDILDNGMDRLVYDKMYSLYPESVEGINQQGLTANRTTYGANVALETLSGLTTFNSLLPYVKVVEENGTITVTGIPAKIMMNDIYRTWKTMRVPNNLFIERGMRYFKIHSFFAIELVYILEQILTRGCRTKRSTVKDIISKVYEGTWLNTASDAEPLKMNYNRIASELNISLLPAQSNFLENFAITVPKNNLKGQLLAAAPGTGKTIAGFAFSLAVDADLTIIVGPKNSIHEVWEVTLLTRFKKPPTYWTSLDKEGFTGREKYLIVHYDALKKVMENISKIKKRDTVIWLDESHNFNELTAARTRTFIDICKVTDARYTIWASGTPLKAIGKEVVPLICTIDPLFTPEVQTSFIKLYGATTGQALDVLAHRLSRTTFKVEKGEVVTNKVTEITELVAINDPKRYLLSTIKDDMRTYIIERTEFYKKNMPQFVEQFNEILTTYEQTIINANERNKYELYLSYVRKMHKSFDSRADVDLVVYCKRFEREYIYDRLSNADKKIFKKVSSVYKYVALTIRGECLGNVLGKRRAECFSAMLANFPTADVIDSSEKKTLFFTSYVSVADTARDKVREEGYKPLMVYGDTNSNLPGIMRQFRTDKMANPMIATYASLSTAVPVIEASTCVLLDLPFREHIRYQAVSRVDRLGQDVPVRIVTALLDTGSEDNISTRNKDIMDWSKAMVDQMLGFDSTIVADNVVA